MNLSLGIAVFAPFGAAALLEQTNPQSSDLTTILVAVIGVIGAIGAAYFANRARTTVRDQGIKVDLNTQKIDEATEKVDQIASQVTPDPAVVAAESSLVEGATLVEMFLDLYKKFDHHQEEVLRQLNRTQALVRQGTTTLNLHTATPSPPAHSKGKRR